MFPHQFFDLTPFEVTTWIGPAHQGQMEVAWQREAVSRMRKIPQKPSELWKEPQKLQTADQMHRKMRAYVEQLKKNKKKK
ncbi:MULTISPECIES: hypothetical protein [Mesorhizobium]|uniref:hypothetical protein n=1 Tax=Mesorhizobium TaxID=68287 RepID=UPI0007A94417|nr:MULTISPECIES: hypothetical protein [Mesorhizobium]AMX93614.1 hypothetical protein A4R28_11155 [Mesorhizobium ciceri]MDF3208306.1 hypothetical protein [Mesorhizobium sp. LMG15046]MDF3229122.1 hypothetical protein [Mesorhizobium sp. DSM 30133]RUU22230.1 hypothetical protein EOC84_03725 [Mesorhizobium sp. Primo-B]RUU37861.1 hypothetical protein EOC83_16490 [Mesorhizobium sp. Primo-A]